MGVAINGAIVVLAAIRAVPAAGAAVPQAVTEAVRASTRHVVATSLTTAGGFLPLLLFTGGDFWPPLALDLAGGVLLSAPLALVFTPAAYCLMYRWTPFVNQAPARIAAGSQLGLAHRA